jgi:hypothetical protein
VRIAVAVLLAALVGCGKEPEKDPLETEAYRAWKESQILRRLPMAAGGLRVKGRIDVFPPEQRSKTPQDFCEVYVNGNQVGRYNVAKLPDGSWPRISVDVDFNSGPNTFDVWDSTSNKYYRQQVDTREFVEFTCAPTADGFYEIQGIPKKKE